MDSVFFFGYPVFIDGWLWSCLVFNSEITVTLDPVLPSKLDLVEKRCKIVWDMDLRV